MYTEDATSFIHPPTHPRYFPFDKKEEEGERI
jgi:hypothetical protein